MPYKTVLIETAIMNKIEFEYLKKDIEDLMLELEKHGDAEDIECASKIFKEEWSICIENFDKNFNLPSIVDHFNEMKSAFDAFQTKWMSFQQNHFDLDEDVAFKSISEKYALVNNKANQAIENYDAALKSVISLLDTL